MRAALFLVMIALFTLPAGIAQSAVNEKFAVYYADKAPVEKFKPYQLLVFDSIHHPPLLTLKEDGKTLLAYVTLGEIKNDSPYFDMLKSRGLILEENKNWPGNFLIDVRNPLWAKTVIEDIIPAALRQQFDGVFLDTLDDAVALEKKDPGKYAGMTEAAVHLVEGIRMNYPNIKIMINRAYGILPAVAPSIDMELGESVYASYNFDKKSYDKVVAKDYEQQVDWLQKAKQINPQLKIYTLDYADPSDHTLIADIYHTERGNGFIPYVSTIELDRLVEEPGSSP